MPITLRYVIGRSRFQGRFSPILGFDRLRLGAAKAGSPPRNRDFRADRRPRAVAGGRPWRSGKRDGPLIAATLGSLQAELLGLIN